MALRGQPYDAEQFVDPAAFLDAFAPPQSGAGAAVGLKREFEVVVDGLALKYRGLLELAADAEFGDFGLVEPGEVVSPSNMTSPVSGRVLPVTTSIIVVLPAPFGPMMARISPA